MFTKIVASGLCVFGSLNVWAAHPAFNKTNPFGENHPRGGAGIIWGDYDSDGKPDALIIGGEWDGTSTFPKLFKNNGDKTFTDVTATVFGSEFSKPLYKGAAAWLDYDKDGALDLIISGQQGIDVSDPTITKVYKNAGSAGSYALAEDASITLQAVQSGNDEVPAQYIAVADYDGDTYPDVLIAGVNGSDKYFYLYKNNGTGGFTRQETAFNGGEFPAYDKVVLAWGDFNGDGKPDILYSGHGDGNPDVVAGIYKNKGDGTFEHIELPSGTYNGEVAWIDYNHDSKLDALITGTYWDGNMHYWNIYLYTNNGDDTFTPVDNHGLPVTCNSSVAVGDIDKDGYDDLVIIGQNQGGGANIFYNNRGDSTLLFAGTMVLELGTVQKGLVRLVDVDGDGDLDISIAGDFITPVLYENKYPEPEIPPVIPPFPEPAVVELVEFTEQTTPFPVNLQKGGAAWGDYDNDGDLDVLVWGYYDSESATITRLYRNNGNGTFTDQTNAVLGSSFPKIAKGAAAWFDYNNDGYLDLIVSGTTTINNIEDGTQSALQQTPVTEIYTNEGPIVGYLLNKELAISAEFQPFDFEKSGGIARNIAIADYDNDGWQDILFCSRYTDVDFEKTERRFEIYKNKPKGNGRTFELQSNTSTGLVAGNGGGVAWGDYNKDGYQDILFSSYRDGVEGGYRTGVFTSNGDGTFTETLFFLNGADYGHAEDGQREFGTETGEVTWVDVNADGYLDAIITGSGNMYKFNGDLRTYTEWGWEWWKTVLFVYNPDSRTFGGGLLQEMFTRMGGTCESGVTWVDLNDDGLPDVITSGQHEGSSVNYNTSNGIFNRQSLGKNLQQGTVTAVDYDKDGKVDILATGQEGVVLFKNTSSITPVAPAAPTGFTATPGENGALTLSWAAASEPTIRYNIFAKKSLSAYSEFVISLLPVDVETGALRVSLDHSALLSTNTYSLKGIAGGEYTVGVQAVSINGKTSAFTTATVTVTGGGDSNTKVSKELTGAFNAYKSGEAIVVTTDIAQEAALEVYSISGAKVWSKAGSLAGTTYITGLQQDAVYFVVLRAGDKSGVKKVKL
jgi:hypothetical protein